MRTVLITIITRILSAIMHQGESLALPHKPERILVIKSCCLGDVLLTTPLLHALRQHHPQAQITYAVGAWSRPMVATSKDVDVVLTIPDRWTLGSLLAVARFLRVRHFDMVFVPERTPLPGILCWLAGIPIRIGLNSQGRGFTYTHPVAVPSTLIHEVDLYLSLARRVGIAASDRRPHFFPTKDDRDRAQEIVDDLLRSRSSCRDPSWRRQ